VQLGVLLSELKRLNNVPVAATALDALGHLIFGLIFVH
jgi:hypothetical protein